ncbi:MULTISPECIES: thioester domain-containing protein [Bacillus]|uniref:thioester domain-containing protein n=1 Tax=Bacillus TaxID=1386 RepID=UPI00106696F7|nr:MULTISPECIES: thioester domain-containing protein [Bacillus]MCQ6522641.1 thioester domain-containing protein [Bacillus paranthracis]MCU5228979.1 thioester domain-containing protein [Bacillus paranthracis]MEC4605001.1 thioester domain-containing protein [Bacillus paranthracis]TDT80060.1 TQXA domain-containing protein [Bacillus sp. AG1163]
MSIKQSFKLLAMFLSVLFVLFPLQKAFAEVMDHTKYQMDWSYSKSKKKPIRTELIKTADGKIAFCLNVDLKSPSGQDLPEMGKVDINVYRVLLNGYPQKSPQELGVSDWREAHYATQLAVWNALKQIDINDLDFRNKNVEKVTKDIVAKASASDELQEITMSVTPTEEQEAVLKNDFFETGLYTVETNAKSGTYKVQATGAPAGAKFVNEKGEAKTEFNVGEKFRILVPKQTPAGGFSFKVIGKLTKLQGIAHKGTPTIQNAVVLLERSEEETSPELSVSWKKGNGHDNNKPHTPNEPYKPNQKR